MGETEIFNQAIIKVADKNYVEFKNLLGGVLQQRLYSTLKTITSEKAKSIFRKGN